VIVRVLFPDSFENPVGGLSTVASKMKQYLGDDVDFEWIGYPIESDTADYKSVHFPLNIGHGSLNTITGQVTYFAKAVEGRKPDIIHAFDWTVYLAGVYAARHYDVPLVSSMQLSVHGLNQIGIHYTGDLNSVDGKAINETHRQIEIAGLFNADKIIHVSKNHSRMFPQFDDKSVVISNGIDLDDFSKVDPSYQLPGTREKKVVYIGRFDHMKSIAELLDAKIPDNVDLIIAGSDKGGQGQHFNRILNLSKEKDNVHYIGPVYGEEKSYLLNKADAVIFPSKYEPFGIVGLEAFASKSLLITSQANGISDYASDENSLWCGSSARSISLALLHFSTMPKKLYQQYINNGLETVEHFQWKDHMPKYYDVYKSVLNERDASCE